MKNFFSRIFNAIAGFFRKIPAFLGRIWDFFKRRKALRRTLLALLLVALGLWLFWRFWPPFSARVSGVSRSWYVSRAVNYDGRTFFNADSIDADAPDPYAGRSTGKGAKPRGELPTAEPALLEAPGGDDLTVTWFGHSTVLLQMSGKTILFDPVFTDLASPVPLVGMRRYSPLVWGAEDLPHIDYVIITHDHYDHLDMGTVKALNGKTGLFIVPLGVENDLKKWDVPAEKILTMAWWEEEDLGGGLTVACAPALHGSGRNVTDRDRTLWASFVLTNGSYKVFESGDTGFGGHFEEIHRRYGDMDLVLLDCAGYDTRRHDVHMFPEEAVEAAGILGAGAAMPIHWAAFRFSGHAWDDPAERFTLRAEERGLQSAVPKLGETVRWEERDRYAEKWWRGIE